MKRQSIGMTKNNKHVYVDMEGPHAATHLADTPGLIELVKEFIAEIEIDQDSLCIDRDMGRVVGTSDLVETTDNDEIVYAKRINRNNYTRFVSHRHAVQSSFVTVVLQKDLEGNYELWSAWIGSVVPQFPGDEHEVPESKPFWRKHALVWGNQAIQPGTETREWPWG